MIRQLDANGLTLDHMKHTFFFLNLFILVPLTKKKTSQMYIECKKAFPKSQPCVVFGQK